MPIPAPAVRSISGAAGAALPVTFTGFIPGRTAIASLLATAAAGVPETRWHGP